MVKKIKNMERYGLIESLCIKKRGKKFKFIRRTGFCVYILSEDVRELDGDIYNNLIENADMHKIPAARMASSPSFWKTKQGPLKRILGGSTEYRGHSVFLYDKFCEWESKNKSN